MEMVKENRYVQLNTINCDHRNVLQSPAIESANQR